MGSSGKHWDRAVARRFSEIVVSVEKLRDYCLSEVHPRGRHKARVFKAALGLGPDDADRLARALTDAVLARIDALRPGEADEHGERLVLDFDMATEVGRATIRSAWIVRKGEDVIRFLNCFVL
jgi:hypothetical protein